MAEAHTEEVEGARAGERGVSPVKADSAGRRLGLFGERGRIGIVVFLRNVSEDEIARDRIEAVGNRKIFAEA